MIQIEDNDLPITVAEKPIMRKMTNEKFSIYEQTKPAMEEMLKAGFSAEQVATIANYCFDFAIAIQHMRVELEEKNAECNI